MATQVIIPPLGESITSGILAVWHVQSGDSVKQGQTLFELETDKITSEGTAEVNGVIELKVEEGTEVEIGSVVAVIDESAVASAPPPESPPEETIAEKLPEAAVNIPESPVPNAQHPPSVRRIAHETGLDPASVKGTGKAGRVTKGDMLEALPTQAAANEEVRETRKKMTPLRRTISKRLVQAQQSMAMLTTFNEVDMSAVMQYRKTHQEAFVSRHGVKLGFMSFFTKAVIQALKEIPAVNGRLEGDEIVTNHFHDIGIAVSTPKGLMVPVVKDCDHKTFAQIEKDIIGYATRAKEGKIGIEDLQGGVFTITNGGIFGSMLSTPIVNYPQSAILGMHTIQDRPMAINGEVVIRPMMYLALSYDHRLVDGREAVGFLVSVKKSIEDPSRLLFDL